MFRLSLLCLAVVFCRQAALGVDIDTPTAVAAASEASVPETTDKHVEVPVLQTWSGAHSNVKKAGNLIIRDAKAWKEQWAKINSNRMPQPPLPKVDFDKQMLIALFMGERTTGGHSISVASIEDTGKQIEIYVKRKSPPPGGMSIMVMTQPYCIVAIAKTAKPVVFKEAKGEKEQDTLPGKSGKGFSEITVRQSGGFAGVSNSFTIDADGTYEFTRSLQKKSGNGKLSEEQIAKLTKAVGRQDWTKVPATLIAPHGADMFVYDIAVRVGPKTYKVRCDDMSVGKYPALQAIIGTLGSMR